MTFCLSTRNIAFAGSLLGALVISACTSQHSNSRYGGSCTQPCMPAYQQSYVQTYYQVPVQQAPVYTPLPAPRPSAPVITSAPPMATCPHNTVQQSDGTCLQVERPAYTAPTYTPPTIGYTPNPIAPRTIYQPVRK